MTAVSAVNPKLNFPSCPGGKVDVFLAGTTSRSNTWQDRNQTTLNQNPILLDARGECVAWLNSALRYKFVVKNAAGVTVYSVDNLAGAQPGAASVAQFTTDTLSGTGAQVDFTLSVTPSHENATNVFVDGVYQQKSAYGVSGTTLTFVVAPALGTNNVEVVTTSILDYTDVAADIAASVTAASDSAAAAANSEANAADSETASASSAALAAAYATLGISDKSADYTVVLADANTSFRHPATDSNNRTFTIDSNANVAFEVGTTLTFINKSSNSLSIAITSDTLTLAGSVSAGTRTLAQNGVCTAIKDSSTSWIISGTGLS